MMPTSQSLAAEPAAVLIGGSAGALDGLIPLLRGFSSGSEVPVVVVLHIPPHKPSLLVELLGRHTGRIVREPEDKETLASGHLYVAPPDYHLLFDEGPAFALSVDPPVNFSRPSIDVLFESAADVLGSGVIAVLLSGANADGAMGLKAIADAGGQTIVQDPDEAPNKAMPEAGHQLSPTARVLPIAAIGQHLKALLGGAVAS